MKNIFGKFIESANLPVEVPSLILILVAGIVLLKLLIRAEEKALEKSDVDPSAYKLILRTTKIIAWVLIGVTLAGSIGLNVTHFVAVIASIGAAIALALKDSLSNVAGGIIIIFTKPFQKGDEIEVSGVSGIVDCVDLMDTTLHTFDNRVIRIPNSNLVNSILINRTAKDIVRVDLKIEVSYDSDLAKVRELLNNIVKDGELLLDDPKPLIGVSDHGENGIIWDMFVWARTEDRFKAKYYLEEEVKNVFTDNGISIPFSTVDVRISGDSYKNS